MPDYCYSSWVLHKMMSRGEEELPQGADNPLEVLPCGVGGKFQDDKKGT
jgi:hypothetical protein